MFPKKRKLIPKLFFKRRLLRPEAGDRNVRGTRLGIERKTALFSFPVLIFIASLIISPFIFLAVVASEHALTKFIFGFSLSDLKKTKNLAKEIVFEECKYRHPLDGTCLNAPWEEKKIIAVSLDNMIDGRPQSGIANARLVMEAPVEAGITRLLAFYAEGDEVPEIGPVRSIRPYFLDFAREYGATLAHVGGSPEALDRIKKENIPSIDEYKNGSGFWRARTRLAPHATFTSSKNLFSLASVSSGAVSLSIMDEKELGKNKGDTHLRIAAASSAYEVQWKYDQEKNSYERLQSGASHKDSQGKQIYAKNIMVMRMPILIIDDIGRRSIASLGSGTALVLRNGEVITGTWNKESLESRTVFLDNLGKEIKFVPGVTWIEVVSKTAKVEYNQ